MGNYVGFHMGFYEVSSVLYPIYFPLSNPTLKPMWNSSLNTPYVKTHIQTLSEILVGSLRLHSLCPLPNYSHSGNLLRMPHLIFLTWNFTLKSTLNPCVDPDRSIRIKFNQRSQSYSEAFRYLLPDNSDLFQTNPKNVMDPVWCKTNHNKFKVPIRLNSNVSELGQQSE